MNAIYILFTHTHADIHTLYLMFTVHCFCLDFRAPVVYWRFPVATLTPVMTETVLRVAVVCSTVPALQTGWDRNARYTTPVTVRIH